MPRITAGLAAAVTAGVLAIAGTVAPAAARPSSTADLPNFRVGIQMIDNGSQIGDAEYTPYSNFGGGCSPFAGDTNTFDPDGARLFLEPPPRFTPLSRDFRIGAQVTDHNGSQTGVLQWSPWASEGGGVSDFAFDTNGFDPDQVKVCLETRDMPAGVVFYDFRLSIKAVDQGSADQGGTRQFTPWAADGGGASPWAYDSNAWDPDGFAVGIEVY